MGIKSRHVVHWIVYKILHNLIYKPTETFYLCRLAHRLNFYFTPNCKEYLLFSDIVSRYSGLKVNVGSCFCKTKDRIAKEQREDVIYFIVIRNIGQTKRLFRTRLKEH